ncbi:MAG: hypothetical protein GPOALKHO_000811 [Sodalis sp.]|uniref:glycoside hydrolase family 3 C-terminal domain-containing protein n=1 Tax=Sodalis sp. (in: enterobacteria) TaxID=1898979 RepID=UPI00387345F4|nr:MAG: hypothetical protein GPOALKHO_000811 [Sodalis sp.]
MIDDAASTARQAGVIMAAAGEAQGMVHEASSRSDITVPESQRRPLRALKATGKPLVVVLLSGVSTGAEKPANERAAGGMIPR